MSTPTATTPTRETKLARMFGLEGDDWMRHANPVSVWTRFSVLPLLAISVWSRDWIGWWSLVPIALSLAFMGVSPLLFSRRRMVLLFEDLKSHNKEYSRWEY